MADTTISALTPGAPAGNDILPYGTGNNTLGTAVSALFQLASHKLGIGTGNASLPDLSKLEVVGCGDVVSSYFNVRSWARFKADNTITNYAIMFDTGAPASSVSVRGLVFSYQNTAMGVVRFDANKTSGYTTDVTISSGGNVLIGGAGLAYNPVHRLEVDGTIKATALQVPGCIIQVKQAVKTNIQLMNLSSFEDVSGLSVSITPKALGSSFLVQVQLSVSTISTQAPYIRITRNGNAIGTGAAAGNRTQCNAFMYSHAAAAATMVTVPINYVDAPSYSDLSPIIYKVQLYANSGPSNGNVGINCNCYPLDGDTDHASQPRASSSIIVQEIAG